METFKFPNIGELEGYIGSKVGTNLDRIKEYLKTLNLKKWPKKGNIDDVKNNAMCLMKLAHECRTKKKLTFGNLQLGLLDPNPVHGKRLLPLEFHLPSKRW